MLVLDLLFFQSFGNAASNKCNDIKGMENLLKRFIGQNYLFAIYTKAHYHRVVSLGAKIKTNAFAPIHL